MSSKNFNYIAFCAILLIVSACLVFGGTSQKITNFKQIIYLICSLGLAVVSYFAPPGHSSSENFSEPIVFTGVISIIVLLSLLPLPYFIWSNLPNRDLIAEVFKLTETSPKYMPLSMAPERTWLALLSFIPILTVLFLLTQITNRKHIDRLVWIYPIAAFLLTIIGFLQVFGQVSDTFYKISNVGYPLAFFSNVNHMGTFLLMSLPFTSYLFLTELRDHNRRKMLFLLAVIFIVSVIGILSVKSFATYGLFIFQIFLFILFALNTISSNLIKYIAIGLLMSGVLYLIFHLEVLHALEIQMGASSLQGRNRLLSNSLPLILETFPFGTGAGAFEDAYRANEELSAITPNFVNHVHNDYIEAVIEMGLLAILLIGYFCFRFFDQVRRILKLGYSFDSLQFVAANSLLIVLLHSAFDYPLRTPAIAIMFTIAVVFLFEAGSYCAED